MVTEKKKQQNLLILDDDPVYRNLSESILKERFIVFTAGTPSQAFKILKREVIQFFICDFRLPEMDGLKVLEKVKHDHPLTEVIMISNAGDMETVIKALRKGAVDYFRKPFTASDIWMSIERTQNNLAIKQELQIKKTQISRLKEEIQNETFSGIIGTSDATSAIVHQMKSVARAPDTSVLITGESGTGKELVARGIHRWSKRVNEIFSGINMSAVSDSLFESEFFGHTKGSFTGADADKPGWLEHSNMGTLFLDEVGDMNLALQAKLLRVLEERTFVKVGTQVEKPFDVRVISATNRPIEALAEGKDFRLDLFHRLGTFIIHIPPLRERRDDIPVLAEEFLKQLSWKMGKNIHSFHKDAMKTMVQYSYPGNVRELKNIVERAVILCEGPEILPKEIILSFQLNSEPKNTNTADTYDLIEIEKQTILRALKATSYNITEAASLLNIGWNALYRRMQKYNINTD